MFRTRAVLAAVALALVVNARCKNDSNTVTGGIPLPTATPVGTLPPSSATPTRTPAPAGNRIVNVGQGGGMSFTDQTTGGSTTTIAVGTTVQWVWVSGVHSTTSGTCSGGCTADGLWDSGIGSGMTFSHTFSQAGTFHYFCQVHGAAMTGTVIVQ